MTACLRSLRSRSGRRRSAAAAIAAGIAAAAVASAAGAATAAPAASRLAPIAGVVGCDGRAHAKPAEVVLACADAGVGLRKVTWVGWGGATTVGVGTAFANDCEPNCAAGHEHTWRAVVIASGRQACHGAVAYRTLEVAVVGEPPVNWRTQADATYPITCH